MIYYFLCLVLGSVIALISIDVAFIWKTLQVKRVRSKEKQIPIKNDSAITLSPCPFCGQNVEMLMKETHNNKKYYSVVCNAEEGGCGCSTGKFETPFDAILMWNVRPEDFEWLQKFESGEWKI